LTSSEPVVPEFSMKYTSSEPLDTEASGYLLAMILLIRLKLPLLILIPVWAFTFRV